MDRIFEALDAYSRTDAYPFHMPGHKRQLKGDILKDVSHIDITEIDGFDNLHDPQGIVKEAQIRTAELYHAEESFFLVNGSTCGILSAVSACVPRGGWLLMARNCHTSVYHAAMLRGLKTEYLYPDRQPGYSFCAGIRCSQVQQAVEAFEKNHPGERPGAVILTSPTYEGILSEVSSIAEYLHKKNIPLIVDEAHGAHFGMAEGIPENSCQAGADLVIHSLHKTLPSLTQTALLHVNGDLVDRRTLRRFLRIYQSSSPSYILMASMDQTVLQLLSDREDLFRSFLIKRKKLWDTIRSCRYLDCYAGAADPCKLVITVRHEEWTGKKLYDCLRLEYGLQMEMAAGDYVVAILTIMDTKEGLERLADALVKIDARLTEQTPHMTHVSNDKREDDIEKKPYGFKAETVLTLAEGTEAETAMVSAQQAQNRISAEFVYVYPPGIPLLAPGERIHQEHIRLLEEIRKKGLEVKGMEDGQLTVIL